MAPTHPHGQVNATASSAGSSPDGSHRGHREHRGVEEGIGRTGNISATALDSRQWIIFPSKQVWIRALVPTHPHGQVENATASSAGGSPDGDGEDSRRGAEARRRGGNREDREHFCNGLGQQATDHFPSKQVWIRAWPQPTPMARSKTPPRPLREALRMGMGRTRAEAQRRGGGNREDQDRICFLQRPWTAGNGPPSKQVWIRAWPQPTPMARSKTPPRPLREALRMGMGMGRSGWESGNLFGRARARTRLPTYRSLTASRFCRSEDSGVWGHRRARFPRRGGRRR